LASLFCFLFSSIGANRGFRSFEPPPPLAADWLLFSMFWYRSPWLRGSISLIWMISSASFIKSFWLSYCMLAFYAVGLSDGARFSAFGDFFFREEDSRSWFSWEAIEPLGPSGL